MSSIYNLIGYQDNENPTQSGASYERLEINKSIDDFPPKHIINKSVRTRKKVESYKV